MPKFIVRVSFPFAGMTRREGSVLNVSREMLEDEINKGKHQNTKKPISGLLNHCDPADEATEELLSVFNGAKKPKQESEEESSTARKALMDEFDALEVAYDRRWSIEKLKNELKKAKKLKGK